MADETTTPNLSSDAQAGQPAETDASVATAAPGGVVNEDQVKAVLRRVKDPELSLNIVDLGLIYGVAVEGATVKVDMTLTSPGCPSGPEIMYDAEQQLRTIPGVEDVQMNLVWSPFWSPERIEPRVRAYLGF
jgi:metal-sulfur cluster biosynthetic enzyme